MVSMSKNKGNAFELKLLRHFKPIMPSIERISGSGNIKEGICDLESNDYSIECKHRAAINKKMLSRVFAELESKSKKQAVVIFRRNNQDITAMLRLNGNLVQMYLEDFDLYVARKLISNPPITKEEPLLDTKPIENILEKLKEKREEFEKENNEVEEDELHTTESVQNEQI